MHKVTPNPPEDSGTDSPEALDAKKMKEAADLADNVDGTRRSVALALSRMADGVQLLVERALDDWEAQKMMQAQAKV